MAVRGGNTRRDWCWTSFNADVIQKVREHDFQLDDRLRYLVAQVEVAPDTGNIHVQGFLVARRAIRLRQVKNLIGDDTAHVEPRFASTRQLAADYCKKLESREDPDRQPLELGELVEQVGFVSAWVFFRRQVEA